jgi:hypothetical protein
MADDLLLMRRKQKNKWRQREEDRRRIRQQLDASASPSSRNEFEDEKTTGSKSEIPSTDYKSVQESIRYQEASIKNDPLPLDLTQTESSVVSQEIVVDMTKIKSTESLSSATKQNKILSLNKNLLDMNHEKKISSPILVRKPAVTNQSLKMSDSSDDDDDHLDFYRKKRLPIEEKIDKKTTTVLQRDEQSVYDTILEDTAKGDPDISAEFSRKSETMYPTKLMQRTLQVHNSINADDSSSSDEDLLQGFKEHLKSKVLKDSNQTVGDNDEKNSEASKALSSKLGKVERQNTAIIEHRISKNQTPEKCSPARNPLAKMKEMDTSFKEYADNHCILHHESEETKLWSDSDCSIGKNGEETKRKRKPPKQESEPQSSKNRNGNKEKGQISEDTELVSNDSKSIFVSFDCREIIENEAKPAFSNPKFGPFMNIPLLLKVENDDIVANSPYLESYEVPASINRYLKEYQKDGIRFVFEKAIANRKGAILGDGKFFIDFFSNFFAIHL